MVDGRKNLIPKFYTVSSIPILSENTLQEDKFKVENNCVLITSFLLSGDVEENQPYV